jgi:autotransporter-associated beta strand protein
MPTSFCRRRRFLARLSLAVATTLGIGISAAHAGQKEFTGGTNWLSSGNWTPSGTPGTGDNVVVDSGSPTGGAYSVTGGALTIEDITFTLTTSTTLGNTSSGTASTLTLNGGRGSSVPLIDVNSTKNFTIANGSSQALGVVLAASGAFEIDAAGNLTVSSNITETGGSQTLTVDGAGGGAVSLTGTNSFSGGLVVTGAEVDAAGDSSLGATTGSLTINGGRLGFTASTTITSTRTFLLGANPTGGNSTGTLSVKGSSVTVIYNGVLQNLNGSTAGDLVKQGAGTLELGGASTYTDNTFINNGAIELSTAANRLPTTTVVSLGQASSANLGTLNLNGFNQTIAGLSSISGTNSGSSTNVVTSSTAATLTLNTAGSTSYSYSAGSAANSGVISGAIALVKNGSGTQILGGANTFTGGTTVNNGTLQVTGSLSGGVSIAGGQLNGTGPIGGNVSATSGTILAGNGSPGEFTLQSGLNLSGGGAYQWQLGALKDNSTGTAGTDFAQIDLTGGNLALGGSSALTLDFSLLSSGPNSSNSFWDTNHSWTIITGSGATNSGSTNFASITDPTYTDGSFSTSTDTSGDVLLSFQATPEPQTWLTAACGLTTLIGLQRFRRRTGIAQRQR